MPCRQFETPIPQTKGTLSQIERTLAQTQPKCAGLTIELVDAPVLRLSLAGFISQMVHVLQRMSY